MIKRFEDFVNESNGHKDLFDKIFNYIKSILKKRDIKDSDILKLVGHINESKIIDNLVGFFNKNVDKNSFINFLKRIVPKVQIEKIGNALKIGYDKLPKTSTILLFIALALFSCTKEEEYLYKVSYQETPEHYASHTDTTTFLGKYGMDKITTFFLMYEDFMTIEEVNEDLKTKRPELYSGKYENLTITEYEWKEY